MIALELKTDQEWMDEAFDGAIISWVGLLIMLLVTTAVPQQYKVGTLIACVPVILHGLVYTGLYICFRRS